MKLNMFFFIKDNQLLKRSNKIQDKVSNSIKKLFDNEPVCNATYIKTKIGSYEGKSNINIHDNGISKSGFHYIFLSYK